MNTAEVSFIDLGQCARELHGVYASSDTPQAVAEASGVHRRKVMRVSEVMNRKVTTVGPDASLALAARMMRDQDVGCLPVIEGERLIGMITDRDIIVRGVAEGLDPYRSIVREVMSAIAIACDADCTVEQARDLMAANMIKHLPVLDRRQQIAGVLSLRDITGQFGRCRPHQVTFYKRLATNSGHVCDVEVAKVYLSPAVPTDDVVPTALAKFQRDRNLARWDQVADGYELEEGS